MNQKPEQLKTEILAKTAEYYKLVHEPKQNAAFVAGESRVNYAGRVFDAEEMTNLVDASLEFWLTYGHWSRDFEKGLADYLGVRFALMVNSGSSANLLAFMTLTSPLLGDRQVKRGDEVITVAAGFPTTVAPIIQYGAVPVFVDMELKTANVDVTKLEAAVSPKTKAVMLAHTLGNPFDVRAVKQFCEKHNLWLVEDNCDALGSKFDGKFTGTWGDIGTSSFYPPHHMTMGEGGAVYTDNPLLKKIALSLRDWGRDCWCESGVDNTCGCRFTKQFGKLPLGYDHKYVYSHFGYNLKATDLQAAIGCAQLKKFPGFVEKRKANFARLYEGLKDIPQLQLFEKLPESDPSWFGFLMTVVGGEKCQVPSAKCQVPSAKRQVPSAKWQVPSAKCQGPRAKGEVPTEELSSLHCSHFALRTSHFFSSSHFALRTNLTRNDLAQYLESKKIQTRNLFAGNILKHPCFEGLVEGVDYRVAGELKVTDTIMNDSLWVGLYPGMGEAKLDYMIETIRAFFTAGRN